MDEVKAGAASRWSWPPTRPPVPHLHRSSRTSQARPLASARAFQTSRLGWLPVLVPLRPPHSLGSWKGTNDRGLAWSPHFPSRLKTAPRFSPRHQGLGHEQVTCHFTQVAGGGHRDSASRRPPAAASAPHRARHAAAPQAPAAPRAYVRPGASRPAPAAFPPLPPHRSGRPAYPQRRVVQYRGALRHGGVCRPGKAVPVPEPTGGRQVSEGGSAGPPARQAGERRPGPRSGAASRSAPPGSPRRTPGPPARKPRPPRTGRFSPTQNCGARPAGLRGCGAEGRVGVAQGKAGGSGAGLLLLVDRDWNCRVSLPPNLGNFFARLVVSEFLKVFAKFVLLTGALTSLYLPWFLA